MCFKRHLVILLFSFLNGVLAKGCVQLDSYSFDKVVSKFEASLIKFDTAYPYGAKHDNFEAVCEAAYSSPDLLIAEVQVKDYGEKDNEGLAKRFSITKDDFPVVKLFVRSKDEPLTFTYKQESEFTTNNLKKFIRSKSGVYIGLPGCLEEFDKLASKFAVLEKEDEKKKLLTQAETLKAKIKGHNESKSAETYVKIMQKVIDKGGEFVKKETARVENILKGKLSEEKQTLMQERVNILQSFTRHDEL